MQHRSLRYVFFSLIILLIFTIQPTDVTLAQTNDGQLIGSGGISDEPVVGAPFSFNISVTNDPPGAGVFFEDRLYNLSGVVELPPDTLVDTCSQPPNEIGVNPVTGGQLLFFDNIQNIEVDQTVSISCTVEFDLSAMPFNYDLGAPFEIQYRWEANTLPDESGAFRFAPGPTDAEFDVISASLQAFDLEKQSNTTTGQYQVEGAGSRPEGNNGEPVDWPYTYTLTLENNAANPSTSLQIIDIVPPGVAYLGTQSFTCDTLGSPPDLEPTSVLLSDGTPITIDGQSVPLVDGDLVLTWDLDTLYGGVTSLQPGETCTIVYNTAIPYRFRTSADTSQLPPLPADPFATGVGPFTGDILLHTETHENRYNATGIYDPPGTDNDTPSGDGVVSTPADDANVAVTSGYHSIAKDVSTAQVLQDDVIQYTVNGWISEYYNFTPSPGDPYVIVDVLPDGLDFCGTSRPVGSTPPAYGPNGFYGDPTACPMVIEAEFNGVTLNPVDITQDADNNLVITWHVTDASLVEASDTWTLTYTASVRDFYETNIIRSNPDPATQYWTIDGGEPVSGLDVRNNAVETAGDWESLIEGRTGEDALTNSESQINLQEPAIDKTILNPDTGTFIDNDPEAVTLEIGEPFTYRIELTFPDDLDMRNVIIDDFLPRGQRYIPDSADFTGSDDYPGTPQTAPGVGYSGSTFTAEDPQNMGTYLIAECPPNDPDPGDRTGANGDPADPFLTTAQFLGGLQNLVWYLCRVDNSDNPTGDAILWVVTFDGVVINDPGITNNFIVRNFGHLSGTSSFGITFTLRDNLPTRYVVPDVNITKTNNAPGAGIQLGDPFRYTINTVNNGDGNAYDWNITDTVPAGIRILTDGSGNCTNFTTNAPGDFTCVADLGAQNGTGGTLIIQPVTAGGDPDPFREIQPTDDFDFSFDAELANVAPGATPDETLTNFTEIDYCTQPEDLDLNLDGETDRRCLEDSATNPVDIFDVALDKSHIQPVHVAPQVTTGDFATIGEVYQVVLEVTVPAATRLFPTEDGYVEILDTIDDEGVRFCDSSDGITGCADPVIASSNSIVTPFETTWWTADNTPGGGAASEIQFRLNDIDNIGNTSDEVFTITFTVLVTGEDDSGDPVFFLPATDDDVTNRFTLTYRNDNIDEDTNGNGQLDPGEDTNGNGVLETGPDTFSDTSNDDTIDIDQPYIQTDKQITTPPASIPVQGGDIVDFEMVFTNTGESTAMDVSFVDQLPPFVTYNNDMVCVGDNGVNTAPGDVTITDPSTDAPTFSVDLEVDAGGDWDIAPGDSITCTYTVTVDTDVPAGTELRNFVDADWSTLDGNVTEERIFDDTPDDNTPDPANDDEDDAIIPVEQPVLEKTRLSPYPGETPAPVRIGDVVQYEIRVPLPIGTTRSLVIEDLLDPGLIYRENGTITAVTDTGTTLDITPTLVGSNDGIDNDPDPFRVDFAVSDPACTTFSPCILNDGTNNTVAIITFEAVVADVASNVHGTIRNNRVEASYLDGLDNTRTIVNEVAPFDDEDVRIVEPVLTLDKSVDVTIADAGDTLTYTILVTNTQEADPIDPLQPTAYDVVIDDVLDVVTEFNGTLTCEIDNDQNATDDFSAIAVDVPAAGSNPLMIDTNPAGGIDLRPDPDGAGPNLGGRLECTYEVTVLDTIAPAEDIDNRADVDWSSLDGDVSDADPTEPNERIYDADIVGDGDDDSTTVPSPEPVVDKAIDDADPNYRSDDEYQPGELIPYQIQIEVPEGTISRLTIVDNTLQGGLLEYETGSAVITGATQTPNDEPTITGNTLTWVLDDVTTPGTATTADPAFTADPDEDLPGTPSGTGGLITIQYRLRVTDTAVDDDDLLNTVTMTYDIDRDGTADTPPDIPTLTDTIDVLAEVPTIDTVKTHVDVQGTIGASNQVDAGDTITYTVTLTNTSDGDLYDLFIDENLDDFTDFAGNLECLDPSGVAFSTIEVADLDIDPTAPLGTLPTTLDRFRIAGDLTEDDNDWFLAPGETITCTYDVTVNADVPAGDRRVRNSVSGQGDTANNDVPEEVDLSDNAATVATVPPPRIAKAVDTTAAEYQADGQYQPGELVPWAVTVTLPEGEVLDLVVEDTLPPGFEYVSGSVSMSDGTFAIDTQPAAGDTGAISWSFTSVVVNASATSPTTNTSTTDTLTIQFVTRVTNTVPVSDPPTDPTTSTNTASLTYSRPVANNDTTPPQTTTVGPVTANVEVIRPAIDVTKTVSPTGPVDAGDTLEYTVTITNTGPGIAYDVFFDEDLDDNTDYDPLTPMVCSLFDDSAGSTTSLTFEIDADADNSPDAEATTLDTFRVAGDLTENANPWVLDVDDSITCIYFVTVLDTQLSGATADPFDIRNSVAGSFDSFDGDDDSPANPVDNFEENYTDSDVTDVDTPEPSIIKTRVSAEPAQPGDRVTYELEVALPEGTTQGLIVRDDLPTGFIFEGLVATYPQAAFTLPGFSAEPTTGDTGTINWVFAGDVVNPGDNDTTNDTITFRYDVIVTSAAFDADADPDQEDDVVNTGRVLYTPPGGSPGTEADNDDALTDLIRPSIVVEKRATDLADNDITEVDADNEVRYVITVRNAGPGSAYDVSFTEDLDDNTNYVPGSMVCTPAGGSPGVDFTIDDLTTPTVEDVRTTADATLDTFRVGQSLNETSTWDLPNIGDEIVCEYRVTIDSAAVVGTNDIENNVTGTFDSFDGDDQTPPDDADPYEENYTDSDSRTVTIPDPGITKTRLSGEPVQPGDTITYRVVASIPEGTTNGLIVEDTLPTGFEFVTLSAGFPVAEWGGTLPGFVAPVPSSGDTGTLRWVFDAAVVNTPNNDGTDDFITFEYTVRLTSTAFSPGVDAVDDVENTARVLFTPPGGDPETEAGSDTATVDIQRPAIDVTKTVSPTGPVDAGDTLEYTVTITNTGPGIAYDVFFDEDLDDNTDYDPLTPMVCSLFDDSAGSTTPLTFEIDADADNSPDAEATTLDTFRVAGDLTENDNPWVLDVDDSITCIYFVTVLDTQLTGATADPFDIRNSVAGSFDSFDGDDDSPANPVDTFEENYTDSDVTEVDTPEPSIIKTRVSAEPAQPGDRVTYELEVTLPEGTTQGLIVRDDLPTGFIFEGLVATYPQAAFTLPGFSAEPTTGDTGTINWVFAGDVVNPGDNLTTNDTITFRYDVIVTSAAFVSGTDQEDDVTNTARVAYTPPGGTPDTEVSTDTATVDLLRPSITVVKTVSPTGPVDAGDTLEYTVTITNDGPGVAYDVFFDEDLDDATNYVAGSMSCAAPGFATDDFTIDDLATVPVTDVRTTADDTLDTFRVGQGLTEDTNDWVLNPTESVVCTYDVTVNDYQDDTAVLAGDADVTNAVSGSFDSSDGDDDGDPAADPYEQNYNASDDTTLTVPAPTFDKTRTSPDDAVQRGEVVTYQIVITVPEGNIEGLRLVDTLPVGFAPDASSITLTAGWGTTPALPSVTPTVVSNVLEIVFDGIVQNPGDNDTDNNTITVEYDARVTDTAAFTPLPLDNNNTDDAANLVEVFYVPSGGTETSLGTDEAYVDVVGPTLTVAKDIIDSTDAVVTGGLTDADDTVTYRVTVTNTSADATLYDVRLSDLNNANLTLDTGSFTCDIDGGTATNPTPSGVSETGFSLADGADENSNAWDLAPGSVLTCLYTQTVDPETPASLTMENTVTATGDTADGDQPGEQDISETDTAAIGTAAPQLVSKDVDTTDAAYQADGTYAPGEAVPYVVTLNIPEGAVINLEFVDTLPAGLVLDTTVTPVVSGGLTLAGAPTVDSGPDDGTAPTDYRFTFTSPAQVASSANTDADGYDDVDTVTVTVRYAARVVGVVPSGTDLINTAAGEYDPADGPDPDQPIGDDTAQVTIESAEPLVTLTKTNSVSEVDAGDLVTYTVTIANDAASPTTAFDVFFVENLSDDTDYDAITGMQCTFNDAVSGAAATSIEIDDLSDGFDTTADTETAALDTFHVANSLTETGNGWDLAPGDSIVCTYNIVVNNTVEPGQTDIDNIVQATYDSTDGPVPGQTTYNTEEESTSLNVPTPTLEKDVDDTAGVYQADGTYQNGELVPYVIQVSIPEGTINALTVTDALPTGQAFDTTIAPTITTSWGAPLSALTSPTNGATGTISWTFDSITNPGTTATPTGSYGTISIRFVTRVAVDAAPGTQQNTAGGSYDPPGAPTTTPLPEDSEQIEVIAPTLAISKTADRAFADASDIVRYTVTLENTSTNGAVAFDVFLTDDLDDFTTYVGNLACSIDNTPDDMDMFMPLLTTIATGTDPVTIDTNPVGGIDLQPDADGAGGNPGGRLRCSYDVSLNADVPATTTLINSVTGTGSTADGDQGNGESTFTTEPATTQVNTFDPTISKAFDTTDTTNYDASNIYAAGELVPYVATITIPEGAVLDLQFTDVVPAGMVFDSIVSVDGGPTLTGGAPTLTSGPGDGSADSTYRFAFDSPAQVPSSDNTGSLDSQTVTVRYLLRVVTQTEAATLTNSLRGTYDPGDGSEDDREIGTDSVTITTELPQIDTTKVITQTAPDDSSPLTAYTPGDTVEGGSIIEYQVTVTNTDATATLYDVYLEENPDDGVSFNAGSVTCNLSGTVVTPDTDNADPFTLQGGADEAANGWDLAPGEQVICTYTVTVEAGNIAGANLTNTVTGYGDSADGDQPNEVDINDDATTDIPITGPELRLRVVDPIVPADLPLTTIAREVEYVIEVTLPVGTTSNLSVTDILLGDPDDADSDPIDLEYVNTLSITRGGTDISGNVTIDATGIDAGERVINWAFGDDLTYDPADGGVNGVETVEIRFTALVPDVANNDDGDRLDSSVSMTYSPDGGTTTIDVPEADDSLTDQDIQIAVPALEVDETEDDVDDIIVPGQIVTYTITVRNVGTGLARDLVVDDLLPEGFTYVPNSSQFNGSPITDPAITGGDRQLTWDLDADSLIATDPVLDGNSSLTITYQALVPDELTADTYDTFAQARGNDGISVDDPIANPIPEDNTDHVANDTDPTDDAVTSLRTAAAIEGLVWNDRDADGIIDGDEPPISSVMIELYRLEPDGVTETFVTMTLTGADGSYRFDDLAPGNYIVVEVQDGPINNWESTFDADTGTGGTEADRNRISVSNLTGGTVRSDQNFGDRVAGRVQGFVYLDPNGTGSNANPPDAGDTGFTPVTVTLTGTTTGGQPYTDTLTTDLTGFYQFTNVPDGTYSVTVDSDAPVIQAVNNIDFTPGAVGTVDNLVVDTTVPTPVVPEAHFPFRAPVALTITKNGFNLDEPPLDVDDRIGWIVCVTNPDALPTDITINDNIDTVRLTLVPGTIQAGASSADTCPSDPADIPALGLSSVADTNTISTTVSDVPAGGHAILYFETTVTDPATWGAVAPVGGSEPPVQENGGGLPGLLGLVLYHLVTRVCRSRLVRPRGRAVAALLLALLVGGFVASGVVLSQDAEATPVVTEEPDGNSSDDAEANAHADDNTGSDDSDVAATEMSAAATAEVTAAATQASTPAATPPATATAEVTAAPPAQTPVVTAETTAAATVTPAVTAEVTAEATAAVTTEATAEVTAEVTAEATLEATAEVTAEATAEPAFDRTVTLRGRIFDDANASLVQDDDEPGLAGVEVIIYANNDGDFDPAAEPVARVITGENGDYVFENLPEGDYWLTLDETTLPEGYVDIEALGNRGPQFPLEITIAADDAPVTPVERSAATAEPEATPTVRPKVEVIGQTFAFARDTDEDGAPDGVEGDGDRDNDGIPNYLDTFDPSGVFYIDQTGNALAGVTVRLYADDGDNTFDDATDLLADTLQPNPQTSAADGAYRFDIRTNIAEPAEGLDPIVNGLPEDSSERRFYLVIDTASLPANTFFPSILVTDSGIFDGMTDTGSGQIVPLSIAPNPPINTTHNPPDNPATHRFFLAFDLAIGDDPVVNNHVAFGSETIVIEGLAVMNIASASRPELPPVSDDASLPLQSSLDFTLVPNNYRLIEPGETTDPPHSHILTNTGQQTDSYTLTVPAGTQGWVQTVEIVRGGGSIGTITPGPDGTFTIPDVAPGEQITINHVITAPPGIITGVSDTTTLSAVSVTDPNLQRTVTDITEVLAACVEGVVYNDTNRNGVQDAGETGYGGIRVLVFDTAGDGSLVGTLTTAGDGSFDLGGLSSGDYRVEIDLTTLPAGTPLFVPDGSNIQSYTFTAGTDCIIGSAGLVLFDPALTKLGSPDQARVGDTVTFTITATNNSTTALSDVVVRDPLVDFLDFVSADGIDQANISFDADTNEVVFNIGTLAPSESVVLTVVTVVNDRAPEPGTVTNSASFVFSELPDLRQEASTTVDIQRPPSDDDDDDDDRDDPPPGGGSQPPAQPTDIPVVVPPVEGTVVAAVPSVSSAPGARSNVVPSDFPGMLPATGEPIRQPNVAVLALVGIFVAGLVFGVLASMGGLFLRKWIVRSWRDNITRLIGAVLLAVTLSLGAGLIVFGLLLVAPSLDIPQVAQNATTEPEPSAVTVPAVVGVPVGLPVTPTPEPEVTPEPLSLDDWNTQFEQPTVPATRLVIPALDIDTDLTTAYIENGIWDVTTFRDEVAHLEGTASPGMPGNAVLAGHVTHPLGLGPFHSLDRLAPGDIILAHGEGVTYRYVVEFVRVAQPDEIEYTYPMIEPGRFLTLITCAGYQQATQQYTERIIVRAVEVS